MSLFIFWEEVEKRWILHTSFHRVEPTSIFFLFTFSFGTKLHFFGLQVMADTILIYWCCRAIDSELGLLEFLARVESQLLREYGKVLFKTCFTVTIIHWSRIPSNKILIDKIDLSRMLCMIMCFLVRMLPEMRFIPNLFSHHTIHDLHITLHRHHWSATTTTPQSSFSLYRTTATSNRSLLLPPMPPLLLQIPFLQVPFF